MISVVSPVYRAAGCVAELHRRLVATLEAMHVDYEIVLVDDGSDDGSAEEVARLPVKSILLQSNVGQQRAIAEGLKHAAGEWIVVMDCDLQDPPEAIPQLYAAREELDVVIARRVNRKDSAFRRIASRAWQAYAGIERGLGNFSVIHRHVAQEVVRRAGEPYLLVIIERAYRTVDVEHGRRFHGRSAYTLRRLLRSARRR
ncbi:MAG TPA: glycosyltransferase family 2 protein [Thermoanaerobaculia bacterium]|nr:glycosyltransferase family 2 protein [Thermoanaerobaculia bacterium]